MKHTNVKNVIFRTALFSTMLFGLYSCGSDEPAEADTGEKVDTSGEVDTGNMISDMGSTEDTSNETDTSGGGLTITIGVFTESDGTYTDTGKVLVFDSEEDCQSWSRTAPGDGHDAESHLHYNAAGNVSYDSAASSFTWTEYGPEIDQESIDATCAAGKDGVTKTATSDTYEQDKNFYLKIISVE